MSTHGQSSQDPTFESALKELEGTVTRMEAGQMTLEEALESYRRGTELLKFCQSQLNEAQQQVRVLEGDLLKPFSENQSEP
ncbi:MAG: exodeoxyribonuclease VII small subunit [Pseudomonadota bacterium]